MKCIEESPSGRKYNSPKIECVRQEKWLECLPGIIEWQGGTNATFELNAPLEAYVEDGFLTGDDDKWYFFDSKRDFVKEVAKTELGDCWGIGCFAPKARGENLGADFYIFEKSVEDGGKETVYVRFDGESLVPRPGEEADNEVYGYPAFLLVDHGPFEDCEYDYENNPECMSLSDAKNVFAVYRPSLREN